MQQRTFGKRNVAGAAAAPIPEPGANTIKVFGFRVHPLILVGAVMVVGALAISFSMRTPEPAPAQSVLASTEGMSWVTSQRVARRTCPSVACGVVGEFYYRNGVKPLEVRNGWVRVSEPYDASCSNGRSDYVDAGNAQCTQVNGIKGKFAEWLEAASLSEQRPPDPAEGATGLAKVLGQSDDYNLYRGLFVQAGQELIDRRLCTEEQLGESGGFWATVNLRPRKAYFVHCGNRVYYLDITTMEIFQ